MIVRQRQGFGDMGSADDGGPNFSSRVAEFIQSIDDPGSVSQDQADLDAVLMSTDDFYALDRAYGVYNKYSQAAIAIQRKASVAASEGTTTTTMVYRGRLAVAMAENWAADLVLAAAGGALAWKLPKHREAIAGATAAAVVVQTFFFAFLPTTSWLALKTAVKLPGWDSNRPVAPTT
jgi:hypothetical protein